MDDLNDVLAFTRVAELGSFTAAAQRLQWPKSSVSARVARLEAHLGARLIERNTRKLRLTELGARYHEHARRVILELEHAAATVDNFRSEPSGLLRVSAPVGLGQALLPEVIADYARRHPAVRVFVDLTNRRVDLLEEGFDLALRGGPLADSRLVARKLGQSSARLFASPEYLGRRGEPQHPSQLAAHDLLESGSAAAVSGWKLLQDGTGAEVRIDAAFRLVSSDMATLLHAATSGLGIANLPVFAARQAVASNALSPVLPDWSTRQMEVHAVFPSQRCLSPALRAFVDIAVELLQPQLAMP